MTAFLLDTNHAIPLMHREEPLRGRVEAARNRGDQFSISMTVLGELYYACHASTHKAENLARLAKLLASIIIWDFDHAAAEEYGRIQAEQKREGRKIKPLDAQIAAVARLHGLTVLTEDKHLGWVNGLRVENWLR